MILPDVNVLVYAHRRDTEDHQRFRAWLERTINAEESFGLAELVLSGFICVVTHPRVFKMPSAVADAMEFCEQLRSPANCVPVNPGPRHCEIFCRLCRDAGARGNLVPDAYLAALAIESGCEWVTADRDFGRFSGLRWRHPLQ